VIEIVLSSAPDCGDSSPRIPRPLVNARALGSRIGFFPSERHCHSSTSQGELALVVGGSFKIHLYLKFIRRPSNQSGDSTFHAQTHVPTEPAQAIEEARIPLAHEDPRRPESSLAPPRQGAQAGLGETRFPRIVQRRGHECPLTRDCARHSGRLVSLRYEAP
jgi:hypothetical protein